MDRYLKAWLLSFGTIFFLHLMRWERVLVHDSILLNDLSLLLLIIVSTTPIVLSFFIVSGWQKKISVSISIVLGILLGFRAIALGFGMILHDYTAEPKITHELLQSAEVPHSVVRIYRTNCGATCSFGILVRQELNLILGFSLSRTLINKDRCSDMRLYHIAGRNIELYGCDEAFDFDLRRWVYL